MGETPLGSRDDIHGAGGTGGTTSSPNSFPVPAHELGEVTISPTGSFEAGSYQTFTLTYTAGKFGIDDSGSLRVCFRFASDRHGHNSKIQRGQTTPPSPHRTMPF